ncbi:MAG TPA: hypothetical protein VMB34_14025 [Acetobacteraceae bacterium]|nr:hypothetical protein [Acetobacteraceae bacterium]
MRKVIALLAIVVSMAIVNVAWAQSNSNTSNSSSTTSKDSKKSSSGY